MGHFAVEAFGVQVLDCTGSVVLSLGVLPVRVKGYGVWALGFQG